MADKTVAELDREIAKLQQAREEAAKREELFKSLPLEQRVAIVMHGHLCNDNHTDGCGWFYEVKGHVHNFTMPTHSYWLIRAKDTLARLRLAKNMSDGDMLAVIEAVLARK